MSAGALDGLSIGFRTVKGRTDPAPGVRRLGQIDLWEISVVTFPMLPEARVSAVKRRQTGSLLGRSLKPDRSSHDARLLRSLRRATRLMRS